MATTPSNDNYWKQASNAKLDAKSGGAPSAPKKRSKAKILLYIAGTVLVLAGIGVALAPTIASSIAPGLIASQSPGYMNGQANVSGTRFSWGGPQRIEGLKLTDSANKVVASVQSIELSAGLFSLITGNLDLGTANVTGVKAEIIKRADGSTNLSSLNKPTPGPAKPASNQPASLPTGLRANITLKDVQATYVDQTNSTPITAGLSNFAATANIAPGEAVKLVASGNTSGAGSAGSLSINATVTNWSDKNGKITPAAANVDAKVDIKQLPLALVDAFAPGVIKGGTLAGAMGESADVQVVAKGTLASGTAELNATTPNVTAQGKFTLANNVLTGDAPIMISANAKAVEGFAPTLRQQLSKQQVTFDSLPPAQITVADLRFNLPAANAKPGDALSLAGSGANITAQLGEMRGTVVLHQQGQPSPFVIAPLLATIAAADIAKPVRVQASTNATINGNNAGTFNADITAGGLLNSTGQLAGGLPAQLEAKVIAQGIATAIAQPFVQALNIDLPADVGPSLDAQIDARTADVTNATPGALPPVQASFSVLSANLTATGAVNFDGKRLTTTPQGITLDARRAGAMAGRFISPDTGFAVLASRNDSRGVVAKINSLDIPLNAANQPDVKGLTADVNITMDGIAVLPVNRDAGATSAAGQPLDIQSLTLAMKATPGGSVAGTVKGSLWHESKPFTIDGTFNVAELLMNDAAGKVALAAATMKPTANIKIDGIPATIARLAPKSPPAIDAPQEPTSTTDTVALIEAMAGPSLNLTVNASSQGNGYVITSTVRADRLNADVSVNGSPEKIDVRSFTATSNITPDTVRVLAGNKANQPRLAAPGTLNLSVEPISIPLGADRKPDFSKVGLAVAKITMPGRTLVTNLTSVDELGKVKDLGTFGVEELNVLASVPVGAVMSTGGTGGREANITMTGSLLGASPGGQVGTIGTLNSTIKAELSQAKLAGPVALNLALDQLNTAVLEVIANQPGMLTGALGDRAALRIVANVTPPDQSGQPYDFNSGTTTATVAIDAPRLKSSAPISATVSPTAIRLNQSSKLTWNADAGWINRQFLTPAPGSGATQAAVLRQVSPIEVTLDRLVMPRTGATGAAIEAALSLAIANTQLVTSDGRELTLGNTSVTVASQPGGGAAAPIEFNASIAQIGVVEQKTAAAPQNVSNMQIKGTIDGIVDGTGKVDTSRAVISTKADVPAIPTVLIDAFTTKDGTVVDALGATASMKLNIERFPLSGTPAPGTAAPVIDLTARSDRANAALKGTIKDNVFVSQAPFTANVIEVTQALSKRYVKGLPLMGTFEKTKEDQPATLTITNIAAPLGNDLSKLNADIVFDPGEARFGTSDAFGELLKLLNSKTAGKVGQKLEPINMQVRNGVATYRRWKLPLGEFTLETEGQVNLVSRTVDVITYVPFAALSDSATGKLGLGAGGALNRILPGAVEALTMVPFRTRGSMDNPSTNIDPELMAQNTVRGLRPDKILEDGLKDLLKPREPKLPGTPTPK